MELFSGLSTSIKIGLISENDRLIARAQINRAVAATYGITKEELIHILNQFPHVDEKQKSIVLDQF
jgi:hypothetical protein